MLSLCQTKLQIQSFAPVLDLCLTRIDCSAAHAGTRTSPRLASTEPSTSATATTFRSTPGASSPYARARTVKTGATTTAAPTRSRSQSIAKRSTSLLSLRAMPIRAATIRLTSSFIGFAPSLWASRCGKNAYLLRRFILTKIVLPRQTRDKHRESTQKREMRSSQGRVAAHVLDYVPSPANVVYSAGYGRQPLWYCSKGCCHAPHMCVEAPSPVPAASCCHCATALPHITAQHSTAQHSTAQLARSI